MFDEVGVKQSFENLSNSQSESNRAIVGGVGAVTLLRYRLNKCMLPRRSLSAGNKNEMKKTTKNRCQFFSKFLLPLILHIQLKDMTHRQLHSHQVIIGPHATVYKRHEKQRRLWTHSQTVQDENFLSDPNLENC